MNSFNFRNPAALRRRARIAFLALDAIIFLAWPLAAVLSAK